MTDSRILPGARARLVDGNGVTTREFYDFFRRLQDAEETIAEIRQIAEALGSPDGDPANIPPLDFVSDDAQITGGVGINVTGTLADGVVNVRLADLADDGTGAPLAITRDAQGRLQGTRPIEPDEIPEDFRVWLTDETGAYLTDELGNYLCQQGVDLPGPVSVSGVAIGTAAFQNIGTSGATVPLLNGANTWGASQTFSSTITYGGITQAVVQPGTVTGQFSRWNQATGRYEPFDLLSAANNWSAVQGFYTGSVGTQVGLHGFGWDNYIARWLSVLEADATFSLYAYDSAGGGTGITNGTQKLSIRQDAKLQINNATAIFYGGNQVWDSSTSAQVQAGTVTGHYARWNQAAGRYEPFNLFGTEATWTQAINIQDLTNFNFRISAVTGFPGQSLGGINAFGFDGAAQFAGATINFRVAETWSGTQAGSDIQFRAVNYGTRTLTERFRIRGNGEIVPGADNTQALGTSLLRWSVGHFATLNLGGSLTANIQAGAISGQLAQWNNTAGRYEPTTNIVMVRAKGDLPAAVGGVITLAANTVYIFTAAVDLTGDRLLCSQNTSIQGTSSETASIRSTGLVANPLISSAWTLPMQNISITATTALGLNATANPGQAIDWRAVNFVNCGSVGTVEGYSNFIQNDSAFINSGEMVFTGSFDTIGFFQCIFRGIAGANIIRLPSTLTITRRFRIIYSAFVVPSTGTGLNVSTSASIPSEGYVLDTVNFSGAGTYTTGVLFSDNKALFNNNRGISNSAEVSYYTMNGNATATVIAAINTPVKVAGTTVSQPITQKFTNTANRATYTGAISRAFKVTASLSCSSGNNHQIGIYIAKNGTVISESESYITTGGTGRAEQAKVQAVVDLATNDYIEVWIENATSITNITVSDLSVITESLN